MQPLKYVAQTLVFAASRLVSMLFKKSTLRTLQICVLLCTATLASAQSITIRDLVQFINSSIQLKQSDSAVAKTLHHMQLTEHLDNSTVEELQRLGAGPKTIAALRELADASAKLPTAAPPAKASPPPQAPPPDTVQQGKIIESARQSAMNYSKQLPNYLCLEVMRRARDSNLNDPAGSEQWRGDGTVVMRLSYFEQKEDYKVMTVNGTAVENKSVDQLGGVTSQGEFGSMLRAIFAPESEARFEWHHWATLRGRKMYAFSYDIDQPHSQYSIRWEKTDKIVPAYRGLIYIDVDTNMIMHITQEPYDIPATFPVRASSEVLDYDFQKIGDSEFLVPLKVVMLSRTIKYLSKNEIEFRLYQKFGADTVIKFDETPPPLPEDKLKEKK
jgi:hypothetical protein